MKRDLNLFLDDILESIELLEKYTKDLSLEIFYEDSQIQDAIIRRIEIIGEAAKHFPESVRERHPKIPWRDVIGMRNYIVHDYFGINYDLLWEVATKDIYELKKEMLKISL
jgi:uncharacterized protein with HEPN domain